MNKSDRPDFMHTLAGLAGHYNQELTTADLDLWWSGFQNWSIGDFKAAAGMLFKRCKFMPRGSDFEELRRDSVASAPEAWGNALAHADGHWRQGPSSDPFIEEAIRRVGGWESVALCPTDKLGLKQRDFLEAYEDLIDQKAKIGTLPLRLPASHKAQLEQKR